MDFARARRAIFLLLAIAAVTVLGCGRPAPEPQAETVPPRPAPPTTRELMEGPRTDVALKVAPLNVRIPVSWKLEVLGTVAMLEGPTPSGDLQITVAVLPGMGTKRIDMMIAGAKADSLQHPQHVQVYDLRQVNGLNVFEKFVFGPPPSHAMTAAATTIPTTTAATTAPIIVPEAGPVSWTRLVFVPTEGTFLPCSFGITGITPQQFAQDQEFIRSILDTARRNSDLDSP